MKTQFFGEVKIRCKFPLLYLLLPQFNNSLSSSCYRQCLFNVTAHIWTKCLCNADTDIDKPPKFWQSLSLINVQQLGACQYISSEIANMPLLTFSGVWLWASYNHQANVVRHRHYTSWYNVEQFLYWYQWLMSLPWQFFLPQSLGQIVSQLFDVILILAFAKLTVVYIDIFVIMIR
jgi:hypothetical protein